MVGLGRLELPTSRLSGVRSNQTELQAPGVGPKFRRIQLGAKFTLRDRASRKRCTGGGPAMLGLLKGTRSEHYRDNDQSAPLKGGDPAAGSPTATLLRLHPSR